MALIEWREEFRIGIPSVDYEHQELIALLNDLYANLVGQVDDLSVREFLGEIFARISAHFALEERVMRERAYDQFEEHKADHEALLDEIRDIMDESEEVDASLLGESFGQRLQRWFTNHFKTHDARLHRQLEHAGLGVGEI